MSWRTDISARIYAAKKIEGKLDRITALRLIFKERDEFLDLVLQETILAWEEMTDTQKAAACVLYYSALFEVVEADVFPKAKGGLVGKSSPQRRRGRSLKR